MRKKLYFRNRCLLIGLLISFIIISGMFGFTSTTAEAATIKINYKKITVTEGHSKTLKIKGTKNKVKWTSSNKKIATVSSKGKVTAKSVGKATIKARVKVNKKNTKTFTCVVTVKKNPNNANNTKPDNSTQENNSTDGNTSEEDKTIDNSEIALQQILLDKTSLLLTVGDKEVLNWSLVPSNTTVERLVYWESSDENVVTVSSGIVNAVGVGSATIKVVCGDKYANCYVEVTEAYGSVSGTMTYKSGASDGGIILIPKNDKVQSLSVGDYSWWGYNQYIPMFNEYDIFIVYPDGYGNYTIPNVPVGDYYVVGYSYKTSTSNEVNRSMLLGIENYLSTDTFQSLVDYVAIWKTKKQEITVNADRNTVASFVY